MRRAPFIVFEGIDGSGTTTQVGRLVARLQDAGVQVVRTREPGGTPLGEMIRSLLLDTAFSPVPGTEALLYAASRSQHVAEVILPALERGATVVSDRFVDSSLAYQGYARGLGEDAVRAMNALALADCEPDLVIFLDVPVQIAQMRRRQRGARPDRMEAAGSAFEATVRAAYQNLAKRRGSGALVLDGALTPDKLSQAIWEHVCLRWPALAGAGPGSR